VSDETLQQAAPTENAPTAPAESIQATTAPRRALRVQHLIVVAALLGICVFFTLRTTDVKADAQPGVKMEDKPQPFYPETLLGFRPQLEPLEVAFTVPTPILPATVGDWTSEEGEMSAAEKQILPPDTGFARRNYWRVVKANLSENAPSGNNRDKIERVFCSLVLEGKDATSIHRPQVCLEGQGWKLQNAPSVKVRIPQAGGDLSLAILIGAQDFPSHDGKSKVRTEWIFAYWFVGKDRVTDSHLSRVIANTTDRLFAGRSHRWSYFLLSCPVERPPEGQSWVENEQKAIDLVRKFVAEFYPEVCHVPLGD
jgi:hypothetical protein